MRSWQLTGAALLLGSLAAVTGCREEVRYEKPPTPVRVQSMALSATGTGTRYSAVIEPKTRVDLAFRVSGYVRSLARVRGDDGRDRQIAESDHVTRGMLLAQVDPADATARVQQAQAQLDEATTAAGQTQRMLARARRLYEGGALSRPELEAAETADESVQSRIASARAARRLADAALQDCRLVAPFDGVVLRIAVEVGTLANPGVPAFVVADVSSVRAVFGAPDVVLGSLTVGLPQRVRAEAVPGVDFTGRISNVAPSADPRSRVFGVELTIANREDRLKPGMVVSLEVGAGAAAPAMLVPLGAITRAREKNEYAVYVIADEKGQPVARLRAVRLGEMVGNQMAVTGGLAPGDRVVISNAAILADGEPVRVMP